MCTRILSGILALTTLFTLPALSLEKALLAEKLPGALQDKQALAYFGFDQKGRGLSTNHLRSPQTIQLRGVHYTPEGLDQGAIRFAGSAQAKMLLPVTAELTLSAWFLPTGMSRQGFFSAWTLQANQHSLTLNLHRNGALQIKQTTPFSQGSASVDMGRGIPSNQWLHLAMVATPQQLILYLNGQQTGIFDMPVPLSSAHLVIAGQTYRGQIDEVALFKQCLSPLDVQALFEIYKSSIVAEISEPARTDTWETKAARAYAELTRAINSGNWSAAATQATAVSDLVAAYLEDQRAFLAKPAQESIKNNLVQTSNLLKSFKVAIDLAKYRKASDLFDRLDVVWETLEGQLNLPVSNTDAMAGVPLSAPGMQRSVQFSQTWSSGAGVMPGSGFSGGMSMGGFGNGGQVSGGGFSMRSSSGPNRQFRFQSSGTPGREVVGESMGQIPPQIVQQQILMQCQRIKMTLMPLRMSLQNGNWKMARTHARRLPPLLAQLTPPGELPLKPNTRTRRRTLNLSTLPPAQQTALKTKVRQARAHLERLDTALEKRQLEPANTQLQYVEAIVQTLAQWPANAVPSGQPPEE